MSTKVRELRGATDEELYQKAEELRAELFNLRFQKATGRLDNYKRLREVKRELARVLTLLRERELGFDSKLQVEDVATKRKRKLFRRRPVIEEESEEDVAEERDEDEMKEDDIDQGTVEGARGDEQYESEEPSPSAAESGSEDGKTTGSEESRE